MKRIAIALLLLTFAATASAQVPTVGIYFNEELTWASRPCQGTGVLDTVYVGAKNFNMWVSTLEFRVQFGGLNMTPISEVMIGTALRLGTVYGPGTTITWPTPRFGWNSFIVEKIAVIWQCDDCATSSWDDAIDVVPHATTGNLEAVEYLTFQIVPASGIGAVACGLVATEETSWGRIKAMYK